MPDLFPFPQIDNVVMRNESTAVRTGTVPWRPVQLRPLIRTNIGSVPTMTGTVSGTAAQLVAAGVQCYNAVTAAFATCTTVQVAPLVGQTISVPTGYIYDLTTSQFIANHVLTTAGATTSLFNLTSNIANVNDWTYGSNWYVFFLSFDIQV